MDFCELLTGQSPRQRLDALPEHGRARGGIEFPGQLLGGGDGFKRHAVPDAAALFHHGQDAHMTRASDLRFSTSVAAASFGLPSKSWVCLVRSGRCTPSRWMMAADSPPPSS